MEEKKWCVYIHTSPSNKAYIGITCDDVKKRWKNGHGYTKDHQYAMYRAIQKYGWDNFEHIIFANDLSEEQAKHIEMLLIALYKTNCSKYNNPAYGYNMTDGGDGSIGHKHSNETRKKMSDIAKHRFSIPENNPMYDKKHSEETRHKISEKRKGSNLPEDVKEKIRQSNSGKNNHFYGIHRFGDTNPMYGKRHSEDAKRKMSENRNCEKVICVETGIVYINASEAGRQTGIDRSQIAACYRKDSGVHTAGGFHWKYEKYKDDESYKEVDLRFKAVVQCTLNGDVIKIWDGSTSASKALNINRSSISACCLGNKNSAGGFLWRYATDEEAINICV